MENTPENKLKFITQYWGQKIGGNKYTNSLTINKSNIQNIEFISLKYISLITEIDIAKCLFSYSEGAKVQIEGTYWRGHDKNGFFLGEGNLLSANVDYLRSQGFAMPFMGIRVEKFIEYGWIKLIENAKN